MILRIIRKETYLLYNYINLEVTNINIQKKNQNKFEYIQIDKNLLFKLIIKKDMFILMLIQGK